MSATSHIAGFSIYLFRYLSSSCNTMGLEGPQLAKEFHAGKEVMRAASGWIQPASWSETWR